MNRMRPGVYASYTVTAVSAKNKGRAVTVAAKSPKGTTPVQKVTSFSEAKALFGAAEEGNDLMQWMQAVYDNGSPVVYAKSMEDSGAAAYQSALEELLETEAYVVCWDKSDSALAEYAAERLAQLAERGTLKLAVCRGETENEAVTMAKAVNSARVCLTYPKMTWGSMTADVAPAVLAAQIAGCEDLGGNLNGALVQGDVQVVNVSSEDSVNALIRSGVCVFEQNGSFAELIRGVTTATMDEQGNADATFRNLSVTMIADVVMEELRALLQTRLLQAKGSKAALDSIASLVVCQLSDLEDQGLLSGYEMPAVYLSEEDSTVCMVEVQFTVLQGIQQVVLNAQIMV